MTRQKEKLKRGKKIKRGTAVPVPARNEEPGGGTRRGAWEDRRAYVCVQEKRLCIVWGWARRERDKVGRTSIVTAEQNARSD